MNRHRDRDRDRRREQRVRGSAVRARVRPGHRLIIIDLSACGALVEAGRPLRPGSHVDVHLESDVRRGTVTARVVRCAVAAIDSESGVTYRAALSFNDTCDWVREVLTPAGYGFPACASGVATGAHGSGDRLPAAQDDGARMHAKGAK
jgi:PilZ domain-containing protein